MPLLLEQQVKTNLPINVEGICPSAVQSLSATQVGKLSVFHGNEKVTVRDLFGINGSADDDQTIRFSGELISVNGIGSKLADGTIVIDGNAGRHVGSYMSGGKIVVNGNVDDFLGMAMTGGEIQVNGNAGDHVGTNYPGVDFGMNRGIILIAGNVGNGVGQRMRRGTIVVGGSAGRLAGWDMRAGTLILLGDVGGDCGTNMKRGTIVLGNPTDDTFAMFARGETGKPMVMSMLARWLRKQSFEWPSDGLKKMSQTFCQFHGDQLAGGRGEIFVPVGE